MMAFSSEARVLADIAIDLIDVPAGRRRLDPTWVEALAGLFASQGHKTPIEVMIKGERYRLVYGAHRLMAAGSLGWTKIAAVVKPAEAFAAEADLILAEITENLGRRELSALDRAVDISRWREAYEAVRGTVRRGRPSKLAQHEPITDEAVERFATSFSDAAQRTFGISAPSIKRSLQVASIPADLRHRIALLPIADNQSDLLALAAEPADRQAAIVALLTSEPVQAATVSEALRIVDRLPPLTTPTGWERLSGAFSRLKERDQHRFFALHQDAIQSWLAAREGGR